MFSATGHRCTALSFISESWFQSRNKEKVLGGDNVSIKGHGYFLESEHTSIQYAPSKRNNYEGLFISRCQNLSKMSSKNHREKQGKLCVRGDVK